MPKIGKINAAAIEIWTMDNNYYFDDIVVANDPAVAKEFSEKTWTPKSLVEVPHHTTPCRLASVSHIEAVAYRRRAHDGIDGTGVYHVMIFSLLNQAPIESQQTFRMLQ